MSLRHLNPGLALALTFSALRGGATPEEAYAYFVEWDVGELPKKEERPKIPEKDLPWTPKKNRSQKRREQRRRAKGRK